MNENTVFGMINEINYIKSDWFFNVKKYQDYLQTQILGRYFHYKRRTSSTMDDCKFEISQGSPTGTVVLSEVQTKGRGQKRGDDNSKNREWVSNFTGNLYFSYIFKTSFKYVAKVLMSIPISICHSLSSIGLKEVRIKWPNDILVKEKKISGILVCSESVDQSIQMNIGIGINVFENISKNEKLFKIATSCFDELGSESFSREKILALFFNYFEEMVVKNVNEIVEIYENLSFFRKGKEITVMPSKKEVSEKFYRAIFIGFDDSGNMKILKDGKRQSLAYGEVSISKNVDNNV